jgi:hypothetical protein
VNSGRNQDLGREGLATAEKLGNLKSWAPVLGDGGSGRTGSALKETTSDPDRMAATTALVCPAIGSEACFRRS